MLNFSIVHWNRWDEKFGFSHPFLLVDRNLNNYGWYSQYSLYKVMPEGIYNIPFKNIHIFRKGQTKGERLSIINESSITDNIISCIVDVQTAETMLLFMTYEERVDFINTFHVKFDIPYTEDIFVQSVWTSGASSFLKNQLQIKAILTCPLEISSMVNSNFRIKID